MTENGIELLGASETEGDQFSPRQQWYLGIDTHVADVALEWLSPGGVWVELGSYDSVGRWQLHAAPGDKFRLTTSSAGSRAWGYI